MLESASFFFFFTIIIILAVGWKKQPNDMQCLFSSLIMRVQTQTASLKKSVVQLSRTYWCFIWLTNHSDCYKLCTHLPTFIEHRITCSVIFVYCLLYIPSSKSYQSQLCLSGVKKKIKYPSTIEFKSLILPSRLMILCLCYIKKIF